MDILWIVFFILIPAMALVSIVMWSIRNGIAPMPTSIKAKKCLMDILPHPLQGPIYELGFGWGTLAYPLAKRYPASQIFGYETSPIPYWVARLRSVFAQQANLHLQKRDFFQVPLADASLVVCYLYPGAMRRLKVKFEAELKSGTWVVSNTFAVPGWKPVKTLIVPDLYHTNIYLYRIE